MPKCILLGPFSLNLNWADMISDTGMFHYQTAGNSSEIWLLHSLELSLYQALAVLRNNGNK
jgi:hypothetical protein